MKKVCILMAAAFMAAFLLANVGQADVLANGNFDAQDASGGDIFGSTGWDTFGSGFTTQNSLVADTPNNSFKAFGAGAGAGQTFAATAGQTWAGSAVGQVVGSGQDVMVSPGEMFLQIVYRNAAGQFAGTAAGGNFALGFNVFNGNILDSTSPTDVWTDLGVGTAPAPDDTATVTFNVLVLAPAGGAGYFDSASFDQAAIPEPGSIVVLGLGALGLVVRRRRS